MTSKFTEDMAEKMKEAMIRDLANNCKEEYMSVVGIVMLFECAGGKTHG